MFMKLIKKKAVFVVKKKFLIVGNWKNQINSASIAKKLFTNIQKSAHVIKDIETVICPPMVYVGALGELVSSRNCVVGTQGILTPSNITRTGSITPEMVFNSKSRYTIIGHSEERATGVTDTEIAESLSFIVQYPITPILCVGELRRDTSHQYYETVRKQLTANLEKLTNDEIARLVIAYEPIWAIGTTAKRPCTPDECALMMRYIRKIVLDITGDATIATGIRILYGGSVTQENAYEYATMGETSGLLIGRASMDSKVFGEILKKVGK
jgi:triosephosphate isomerase (TIM)